MTLRRHPEEQIIAVLKDAQARASVQTGPGSSASLMPHSISGGRNMRAYPLPETVILDNEPEFSGTALDA